MNALRKLLPAWLSLIVLRGLSSPAMSQVVDAGSSEVTISTPFLDNEGVPSDLYLHLAGHAGKLLREKII